MDIFKRIKKKPKQVKEKKVVQKKRPKRVKKNPYEELAITPIETMLDKIDDLIDSMSNILTSKISNELINSLEKITNQKVLSNKGEFNFNVLNVELAVAHIKVQKQLYNLPFRKDILCLIKLRSKFPWCMLHDFFSDFNKSEYDNILNYYEFYIKQDYVADAIAYTNSIITNRKAIPRDKKIPVKEVKDLNDIIKQIKEKIKFANIERQRKLDIIQAGRAFPSNRPYEKEDFTLSCVSMQKRAPWLLQFVNLPVKGIAIKKGSYYDKFATNYRVMNTMDWFRAKKSWYSYCCDIIKDLELGERRFIKDSVGYIVIPKINGIIYKDIEILIPETEEIYLESVKRKTKANFLNDVPGDDVLSVAKTMLLENAYLQKAAAINSQIINDIIDSFDTSTIYNLSKCLCQILLPLQRIIKQPQIHQLRVERLQCDFKNLLSLNPVDFLPEVFLNPDVNVDTVMYYIKKKFKSIQNDFLFQIIKNKLSPEEGRLKLTKYKYVPYSMPLLYINLPEMALNTQEDIFYYNENFKMYCFTRNEILNGVNPITKTPLKGKIISDLTTIKPYYPPQLPETYNPVDTKEYYHVSKKKAELSSRLFENLHSYLDSIDPNYFTCKTCAVKLDESMNIIKIPHGREKKMFCSINCAAADVTFL